MNFLFLQTTNPAAILQQYGVLVGSAVICTGLFIWSQIQIYMLKNPIESNAKQLKTNYEALEVSLKTQADLCQGVKQLADAIHRQSEMHTEQLELIRELVTKQEVLAANQSSLMTGLQRVVEQLIDVVKSG